MVGLGAPVGGANPQLVDAGSYLSLSLGDTRHRSQAHPPEDAVHHKGAHAPLVFPDGYDLAAAVSPDHAAWDLAKGQVDDEAGEALNSVVGGGEHFPVFGARAHRARGSAACWASNRTHHVGLHEGPPRSPVHPRPVPVRRRALDTGLLGGAIGPDRRGGEKGLELVEPALIRDGGLSQSDSPGSPPRLTGMSQVLDPRS